jgi:predicted phosphate transport protein (TIGR00153 family)
MAMASFLQIFMPKENKFFVLFDKAVSNLKVGCETLIEMTNADTLEDIEHQGDHITHDIFNELSKTFITPFDREDIHSLTSAMDDILDYIHGSAKRVELYKVDVITDEIIKLAELILKGVIELEKAVKGLKNIKNSSVINEACVLINSIENHADDIFDNAIGRLFEFEKDPIRLVKYKEILSGLETATDKCEDAANVIKTILVKYS